MKLPVRVNYYGDPCKPQGCNHIGLSSLLVQEDFMEFEDEISAYEFLMQCTEPITKVYHIFKDGKVPIGLRQDKLVFQDMDVLEDEYQEES